MQNINIIENLLGALVIEKSGRKCKARKGSGIPMNLSSNSLPSGDVFIPILVIRFPNLKGDGNMNLPIACRTGPRDNIKKTKPIVNHSRVSLFLILKIEYNDKNKTV